MIEEKMQLWVIASLTLGLAPFAPEPHIWGKLKWISGGAVGMQAMDWFDVLLHGTPWLLLMVALIMKVKGLVIK
ncbi:MAG: hypothetical protein H6582_14265 [Crocinitomicaceae bacterium]|nr:hypothetical protein [Crocinitomicaceae bacterium]